MSRLIVFAVAVLCWIGGAMTLAADVQAQLMNAINARKAEDVAKALADGADPNARDAFGRTPLHRAAEECNEAIDLLIAKGAKVEAQDNDGRTPLHLANSLSAQSLIKHKANILATDNKGNTPMHTAAEKEGPAMCRVLYDAGMTVVDARNNSGVTPLHFCAMQGRKDVAEYLLTKGADVNAKTLADYEYKWTYIAPDVKGMEQKIPAGATPLSIARQQHEKNKWVDSKYNTLAEFLQSKGATAPQGMSLKWLARLAPISIVFFIVFMWGLIVLDGKMRGWSRMAEKFEAKSTPASIETGQDGVVGTAGLLHVKNMMRAAATDEGLYLAMPGIFRAGHPPLMIPWSQLRLKGEREGVVKSPVIEIGVGEPEIGTIVLRGGVAQSVKDRLKQ